MLAAMKATQQTETSEQLTTPETWNLISGLAASMVDTLAGKGMTGDGEREFPWSIKCTPEERLIARCADAAKMAAEIVKLNATLPR